MSEKKPYEGKSKGKFTPNNKKFSSKNKKFGGKKGKRKTVVPPEVREMAQEHGLLVYIALAVHKGKITLEQALADKEEKRIRKEKAMVICEKHPEIKLALACSLVKDNISIEEFLKQKKEKDEKRAEKELEKKTRMQNDTAQKEAFDKLTEYITKNTKLVLEKYKAKQYTVALEDFTPYEFSVMNEIKKRKEKIHRLEIKYMYEKSIEKIVKKFIMVDKSLQKKRLRPSHKRDGRFQFSEQALNPGNEIMLAMHEGEMLRGVVIWETPFDIMLNLANNKVWVFKHAVNDCMIIKKA